MENFIAIDKKLIEGLSYEDLPCKIFYDTRIVDSAVSLSQLDPIELIYIRNEDYEKLIPAFLSETKNSLHSADHKIELFSSMYRSLSANLVSGKISKMHISLTLGFIDSFIDFLKTEKFSSAVIQKLLQQNGNSDKPMLAAVLAVLLSLKNGWLSDITINKVISSCILSDLGFNDGDLTVKFLKSNDVSLSEDLERAISHFYEYCDSSGPKKMPRSRIHIYAKISRLVHDFSDLRINQGLTNQEACARIQLNIEKYDASLFRSLRTIFQVK